MADKQARRIAPVYGCSAGVQLALDRYGLTLPPPRPAPTPAPATEGRDSKSSSSDSSVLNGRARKLAKREENRAKREWTRKVDAAVLSYEQKAWHAEVRSKTTGKSPFYAAVKTEWGREAWLDSSSANGGGGRGGGGGGGSGHADHASGVDGGGDQHSVSSGRPRCGGGLGDSAVQSDGRRWRVRMRCSSGLPLAAVMHAENAELHPSPLCTLCDAGASEDQVHVMSACSRYAEARADLTAAVLAAAVRGGADGSSAPRQWRDATDEHRTLVLLRATSPPEAVAALHIYLHRVFKTRAAVIKQRAEEAASTTAAAAAAAVVPGVQASEPDRVWPRSVVAARRRAKASGVRQSAVAIVMTGARDVPAPADAPVKHNRGSTWSA